MARGLQGYGRVGYAGPVDRTAAREDHLGGHSRRRVGLQEERSSLHAVTN